MSGRLGCTLPVGGLGMTEQAEIARRAEALGYSDLWSSEVDGYDAFTPLAVAAMHTQRARLGTGIVNPFTRGPLTLAMSAAAIADLAPGRFCLGLGASSPVIVKSWNGSEYSRPLSRVRDAVEVLRGLLAGERVDADLETVRVAGARLSRPPSHPVPIFIAALRERMLRLAGACADGVLLNWLGPDDIPQVVAEIRAGEDSVGGRALPVEIACRVFVAAGPAEFTELIARRELAAYMTVPAYAKFQGWLGRGALLAEMDAAWAEGRRREASAAIPDQVLEDLILFGGAETCRRQIARYFANGVDTVIVHWLKASDDLTESAAIVHDSLADLAPGPHPPELANATALGTGQRHG